MSKVNEPAQQVSSAPAIQGANAMATTPVSPDPAPAGGEELVLTPGGWRPKAKVHFVEPGQQVSGKGGRLAIVHSATGKLIKDLGAYPKADKETATEAAKAKVKRSGRPMKVAEGPMGASRRARPRPMAAPAGAPGMSTADAPLPSVPGPESPAPITDGWIVYSGWTNASANPISYFKTQWAVPPAPSTDHTQTVFLFNGIQSFGTDVFILQPVLQWGPSHAGGGSYWSITNWYVGSDGTALFGPLIQVNPGDVLEGIMTLTGQIGTDFDYLCSFTGHPTADLTVTNVAELTWANETLECYDVAEFSDYPDTTLTAFHDIEIRLRTNASPFTEAQATINWQVNNDVTDNGQQCLILSNASPAGNVYLYYRSVGQGMYFVNDKSTFGRDEVTDVIASSSGLFPNAFYVMLEGFTINQLAVGQPTPLTPLLSGSFQSIAGVTITPNASSPEYEHPGEIYAPQRIRFPFNIRFAASALAAFPVAGSAPTQKVLAAQMTVSGTAENAAALFELVAGANPYFTDIDPSQDNVFWLSQDLRIFSAAPAVNNVPVPGGPTFGTDSTAGAYGYIQALLNHLNANFSNPAGVDPFVSHLPGQGGALTGDSSVTPIAIGPGFPPAIGVNYNFAIARVRMRGTAGPAGAASGVKVFFRMWSTQTADTDYHPESTYLSNNNGAGLPASPLRGVGNNTIPFFATGNSPDFTDPNNVEYGAAGVNNRTIQINSGNSVWAYFGCFLNVYDSLNLVNGAPVQALLAGTHHCIVAQIAYDSAPITNANGVTMSPENSDKLAQRNLQLTHSDNPGAVDTHRIPQTFDIRPSRTLVTGAGDLLDYPDELMINWGNTPAGSTASIYWPQVDTKSVVAMASKLYGAHRLTAPDGTTLQCLTTKGITYIPIPTGAGENFAGLLTIDLPSNVVKGQVFNIVVRRVSSRDSRDKRQLERFKALAGPAQGTDTVGDLTVVSRQKVMLNWRYVTGTFQVRIPVSGKDTILFPEECTLAVLKWRLQAMSPTNRWYPVLKRYIGYVAARVDGLGGNAAEIKPSLQGVPVKGGHGGEAGDGGDSSNGCKGYKGDNSDKGDLRYTGRICEVAYDCFGDFEGFVLVSCCTERRVFRCRDRGIGTLALHACEKRMMVTVLVDNQGRAEVICGLLLGGCGDRG
jgi:hypothetical protein